MDRSISVEEKIRRAEQIYARRQEGNVKRTATVNVNSNNKKDIKLLKKMVIQILVSVLIYFIIYIIQNNNYIFSEDFLNKAKEILSYDTNFIQIYEDIKRGIINIQKQDDGAIGGAEENIIEESKTEENLETENNQGDKQENNDNEQKEENSSEIQPMTQTEQDIANIKETTTFIKPIEGTISSKYGQREPTTSSVPKNHTGLDIAANIGTKIKSATSGEVVLSSEEGDYGKHLKIQIGEVSIIYAHCNALYVKQGDKIEQGQEIAEVGTTGNSTGPHLHFEVRISERTIDPEQILEF